MEKDVREYLDQVRIEASVKAVDMSDVKFNREVYRQHENDLKQSRTYSNMGVRYVCATAVFQEQPPDVCVCVCVCLSACPSCPKADKKGS